MIIYTLVYPSFGIVEGIWERVGRYVCQRATSFSLLHSVSPLIGWISNAVVVPGALSSLRIISPAKVVVHHVFEEDSDRRKRLFTSKVHWGSNIRWQNDSDLSNVFMSNCGCVNTASACATKKLNPHFSTFSAAHKSYWKSRWGFLPVWQNVQGKADGVPEVGVFSTFGKECPSVAH